jgi:hypothetical protein
VHAFCHLRIESYPNPKRQKNQRQDGNNNAVSPKTRSELPEASSQQRKEMNEELVKMNIRSASRRQFLTRL